MEKNDISDLGQNIEDSIKNKEDTVRRNRNKKKVYTIISVFSSLLIIGSVIYTYGEIYVPMQKYKDGMALFQQKLYTEAMDCFCGLNGFKNSQEMILEAKYYIAEQALSDGRYDSAREGFLELKDFWDAPDKADIAGQKILNEKYNHAIELFEDQEYDSAYEIFTEMSGYKEADDYKGRIIDAYQELFLQDLQFALDSRSNYDTNGNYLGYEKVVGFDAALAAYSKIEFNDPFLEQYKNQYNAGAELQENALTFFKEDPQKFEKIWNEGYLERANAVVGIYELGYHKVSQETYGGFVKDLLEQRIINALLKQPVQADKETNRFLISVKVKNEFKCNLGSIVIHCRWNGKYVSDISVDKWNADEEIEIEIQIPYEAAKDDNLSFELSLEATTESDHIL